MDILYSIIYTIVIILIVLAGAVIINYKRLKREREEIWQKENFEEIEKAKEKKTRIFRDNWRNQAAKKYFPE